METINIKRSCKNIDITNPATIRPWVHDCLERHHARHDFADLLKRFGAEYPGKYLDAEPRVCECLATTIKNRQLELGQLRIRERADGNGGKIRLIGCETAIQQLYDYIAVGSCEDIRRRRIVPQQSSSLPGRGPLYGMSMIRQAVKEDWSRVEYARRHGVRVWPRLRHHVKLDCAKCFHHGQTTIFLQFLSRDCGNDDILWLWEQLLESHHVHVELADGTLSAEPYPGFMIGAVVSEWAIQYLMSFAYRYVTGLASTRRGKRVAWVELCHIYMDDILLMGPNRNHLILAAESLSRFMATIGQEIKPDWHVQLFARHPVDMMGYQIHQDAKVEVRDTTFIKARRMVTRSDDGMSYKQAKRLTSYKGLFDHSDQKRYYHNSNYSHRVKQACRIVSKHEHPPKRHKDEEAK